MAPVCFLLAFFEVLRMRLGASPCRVTPSMAILKGSQGR